MVFRKRLSPQVRFIFVVMALSCLRTASAAGIALPASVVTPVPIVPPAIPSAAAVPPPPVVPPAPVSMIAAASRAGKLSAQILWIDATANSATLNTAERVRAVVDHCRMAHINSIVVDVKPLSGLTLYDSRFAPRMAEWQGNAYPRDFDVLKEFIGAGEEAGIPIYASINTFSEGHKSYRVGPAYRHKEWQMVSYDTTSFVDSPHGDERFAIARIHDAPGPDEMAAFTSADGPDRTVHPGDFYAAYDSQDRITLLDDGSNLPSGRVGIPKGGGLLVGQGQARMWLIDHLKLADTVRFSGENRFVPAQDSAFDRYAVFVNPIVPAVRRRILRIIREVVQNYPIRGIFLDRMRYPNLHADFSVTSRRAFERWTGNKVGHWPEDIVAFPPRPGSAPVRGRLFNAWLEWRSHVIRDFLAEARKSIESVRKETQVGVYVGSWYSAYYDVGVNWGSPGFPDRYDWMTPTYRMTGYAPLLDLICSGTYYPTAWRSEAASTGVSPGATVEGSAEESLAAVRDETAVYGSLYLIQYQGHPEAFRQAIRASLATTGGVMIFDLNYVEQYDWWGILGQELAPGKIAPHLVPGFIASLRDARHAADAATKASNQGLSRTAPVDHPPL